MKLLERGSVVGIFRGFSQGGLEFHADLVLPYRNEFQSLPMHGQFLLVQLESDQEAVLGRITSVTSQGRLVSTAGEDYNIRLLDTDRGVPEDLREQYLRYCVNIRVLGLLRNANDKVVYVPSHRRLPHVGSKVAFLSSDLLQEIAGHNQPGAEVGFLAFGEFVHCGNDPRVVDEPWMKRLTPPIVPRFSVRDLVSRRTFVFARAGFGKSNLVKLLFASLYKELPLVEKRGRTVPTGTVIFDPEGEYFWPDDRGRPGLCDVPHLEDKVVVFTKKAGPSPFYGSFVASDIKLDLRRLRPADVISIALSPEKQDQQNVRKLKGLNDNDWRELVDEVYAEGNAADPALVKRILRLEDSQEAEMVAARANMTTIVRMFHDPSSQMMDMLIASLRAGRICVVDVSQMRGAPALVLSGLILQRVFDHNQTEFTKAQPESIPVIAVLEEAQSVLGAEGTSGEGPYVAWVKEGRKYDLGAVLITQQPGSISHEILSQGDNWFVFHLLSAGDLQAVKKANAHFSDDLLSSLLNEPIPGHAVCWSSASGKSYPLPIRVLSFEQMYPRRDASYTMGAANTYARELLAHFAQAMKRAGLAPAQGASPTALVHTPQPADSPEALGDKPDFLEGCISGAIQGLRHNVDFITKVRGGGIPWRGVVEALKEGLPETMTDRENVAYRSVERALNEVLGQDAWRGERRERKSSPGLTTWVVLK